MTNDVELNVDINVVLNGPTLCGVHSLSLFKDDLSLSFSISSSTFFSIRPLIFSVKCYLKRSRIFNLLWIFRCRRSGHCGSSKGKFQASFYLISRLKTNSRFTSTQTAGNLENLKKGEVISPLFLFSQTVVKAQ